MTLLTFVLVYDVRVLYVGLSCSIIPGPEPLSPSFLETSSTNIQKQYTCSFPLPTFVISLCSMNNRPVLVVVVMVGVARRENLSQQGDADHTK